MDDDKIILLPNSSSSSKKTTAKIKRRVITHTAGWEHAKREGTIAVIEQQIRTKLSGYRAQDKLKSFYDPAHFVTLSDVLALMSASHASCFYCKEQVLTLYDNVREPRQWTLERLDNAVGHTRENVVLACLQCNLRRRTMLVTRYQRTQEMKRVIKLEELVFEGTKVPVHGLRELEGHDERALIL